MQNLKKIPVFDKRSNTKYDVSAMFSPQRWTHGILFREIFYVIALDI